jgi:hypothetical protein
MSSEKQRRSWSEKEAVDVAMFLTFKDFEMKIWSILKII